MKKPIALVTGGSGWLGLRLVKVIAEGLEDFEPFREGEPDRLIRCLILPQDDLTPFKSIRGRLEFIKGDLRDHRTLQEFFSGSNEAILFHCAGIIHPRRWIKEFYEVNVKGTKNLLNLAIKNRIKRLIHVSSNSPFGFNPSRFHLFDESSPYKPYMNYGKSKKIAEELVKEAGLSGKIETVIIRPPWFYGPNQPPRQTLFFQMIRDGKVPLLGDGENRRSMAYVDNICQALLLAERVEEAKGRIYWIADERPYTINEIIDTIEWLLETEFNQKCAHKRLRLPGVVGDIAQLFDWILQTAGLYNQKIHVLSEMNKNIACSIERAKKELGYQPQISLEEGMRRSLKWLWKHQGSLP